LQIIRSRGPSFSRLPCLMLIVRSRADRGLYPDCAGARFVPLHT
jgi:hypothetical protein